MSRSRKTSRPIQERDPTRMASVAAASRALERPESTGEMLEAMFPEGVPKEQVRHLPRIVGVCEGLARAVEGGDLLGTPWLEVAGDALAAHCDRETEANHRPRVTLPPRGGK